MGCVYQAALGWDFPVELPRRIYARGVVAGWTKNAGFPDGNPAWVV